MAESNDNHLFFSHTVLGVEWAQQGGSALWLYSEGIEVGDVPKSAALVCTAPGLERLTQLGLLKDFSLSPHGLSTRCLHLGIFAGPGLLT